MNQNHYRFPVFIYLPLLNGNLIIAQMNTACGLLEATNDFIYW